MPTSAQVDAILQDDYKDYRENLNQKAWLLAQIEAKKDTVNGRVAKHAVHIGRSGAVGARGEGAVLPTADQQRSVVVPVPVRTQTARIQLSVQLMKMAKGDPGSFVDALESEMKIQNDLMRDVNRQLYGTSNGVIATCGTTSSSVTIVLLAATPLAQMRHLYVGRTVDIGTVGSPQTIAATRTITAVNIASRTITISGATVSTTSGTHFIFNTLAGGASNNNGTIGDGQIECTGLQTIVAASGILHTVDPATTPAWVAQVYSNSGTARPLSETTLDMAILLNQAESGSPISALVSNAGVFVAGKAILSGYQRNIDTMEFKGGFQGIKWSTPGISGIGGADLGWMADFDCTQGVLYGLTFDDLVCHQESAGWEWMNEDGAILSRVQNQLAYEATLFTMLEMGCVARNSNFLISDLIEAS